MCKYEISNIALSCKLSEINFENWCSQEHAGMRLLKSHIEVFIIRTELLKIGTVMNCVNTKYQISHWGFYNQNRTFEKWCVKNMLGLKFQISHWVFYNKTRTFENWCRQEQDRIRNFKSRIEVFIIRKYFWKLEQSRTFEDSKPQISHWGV